MFYALNWFVVVSLFMLWSLAAWAFHSIAAWTVANAGTLAGGAGSIQALQTVLEWAPALSDGLSIAVWTVWAIGAVLVIVLGFLVTGLIAVLSRRMSASATSSRSLAAAR